jgi:hypothetical protein
MVRPGDYYIKYPEIKADRQVVKSNVGGLTFPDLY